MEVSEQDNMLEVLDEVHGFQFKCEDMDRSRTMRIPFFRLLVYSAYRIHMNATRQACGIRKVFDGVVVHVACLVDQLSFSSDDGY